MTPGPGASDGGGVMKDPFVTPRVREGSFIAPSVRKGSFITSGGSGVS
jgi:hypothetical protein